MSAYKKLLKNTGLFAISNFGSKLISIILVPYYTYVLSTSEYGTIDMIITSISLILPLITLSIFDGTLRFAVKSKYKKEDIFTSSMIVIIMGNLVFLLFYPLLKKISLLKDFINLFYLIVFLQGFNSVLAQFARGIGKVKQFAINGIMNTFVLVISNIVLLSNLNMGIKGYLTSIILAYLVTIIYLVFSVKIWNYFSLKKVKISLLSLLKEMIGYSIPLIPNSLMWWIMNVSDRYIINLFLGLSANGLYAVANKIPTILNVLYSIFSQAWQLSAIEEGDSKNKSEFYTNVFKIFSTGMLIGTSMILMVVRPLMEVIVANEYKESWRYVPFLLLAVVFTSFSSFLGTNYIAMKETRGVLKTSLIGALINIFLNILLIPYIGVNGAAIATMISFFTVWVLRIFDTKRFVEIKLDVQSIIKTLIAIIVQIFVLYLNINYYILIELLLVIFILFINKNILLESSKKIIYFMKNKRKGNDINGKR